MCQQIEISRMVEKVYAELSNGTQELHVDKNNETSFRIDRKGKITGEICNLNFHSYAHPFPNPFGDSRLYTNRLLAAIAISLTRFGIEVFVSAEGYYLVKDTTGYYHDLYRFQECMFTFMLGMRKQADNVGTIFASGAHIVMPTTIDNQSFKQAGDWLIRKFTRDYEKKPLEIIYQKFVSE